MFWFLAIKLLALWAGILFADPPTLELLFSIIYFFLWWGEVCLLSKLPQSSQISYIFSSFVCLFLCLGPLLLWLSGFWVFFTRDDDVFWGIALLAQVGSLIYNSEEINIVYLEIIWAIPYSFTTMYRPFHLLLLPFLSHTAEARAVAGRWLVFSSDCMLPLPPFIQRNFMIFKLESL